MDGICGTDPEKFGVGISGEAMGLKPISCFVGTKCGGGDDPKQAKPKREC